ncbi:MAG TPA: DUF6263 family protein [Chitinophagaceae bacterium]|nr:DUF6263 family protein [Chitinophagaceae bacterium]
MKRILLSFFIFFFPFAVSFSQKVSGKLQFLQGQIIGVTVELKTTVSQEAAGQAIDFTANGTAWHSFKVTNATDNNTTLHHDVKRISFNFDGMGQKRSVDSDNPKDLEGFLGKPVKEILSKNYDMIIDPGGTTLLTKPEKIQLSKIDDRLAVVFNLLKDITGIIYPPKKNEPSFFKVLPDTATGLNASWSESGVDSTGMYKTTYTLSAITDSTLIVDLKGSSSTVTKNEMMGMQTTTSMNSTYTGKLTIDKLTGIIREKTITTSSNGSTEAMGGTLPVTSKTTIVIRVKPVQ